MAMTGSDAYFIPYLVCGTAGILCCCALNKEKLAVEGKGKRALIVILAGIFSCAAALANYKLFVDIDCPNGTVSAFYIKSHIRQLFWREDFVQLRRYWNLP